MTQTQIQVVITTQAGFSATASDATVAGQGSAAYGALQAHRDIYIAGETITFIPYDAIDHAVITITQATVDDPEDATCPAEESDGGEG